LRPDEPARPVVITGAAGVGKTTLAVHCGQMVRGWFPDGQLYLDLRGFGPADAAMSPSVALRDLLFGLGTAPEQAPTDLTAQIGLYRSLLAERRLLILLDNARDAEQVRPLLPHAPGCRVVITSRDALTGLVAREDARPVGLPVLNAAESRQLLATRLGPTIAADDEPALAAIVQHCAGLPLALSIVVARALTRPGLPLTAIAAELTGAGTALAGLEGPDVDIDVRTVFSWSYAALRPEAATMFRRLGVHKGPDISVSAAASLAGIAPGEAARVLTELRLAHLVQEETHGRFSLHDLIHAYAAEMAATDDPATTDAARRRLYDHYLRGLFDAGCVLYPERRAIHLPELADGVVLDPFDTGEAAQQWHAAQYPALVAAIWDAVERGPDEHGAKLGLLIAMYQDRAGHWAERVRTSEAALRCGQRGADRWTIANLTKSLAQAYTTQGQFEAATRYFLQSADLYHDEGDPSGEARARLGLAVAMDAQNRPADTCAYAEGAAQLFRECDDKGGLALALNTAGWARAQLGDLFRALDYCDEAIALFAMGSDLAGEAATWDTLGYVYQRMGSYREATAHYQRAMEIYVEIGDIFRQADARLKLAACTRLDGEPDSAREQARLAVALLEQHDHPAADQIRTRAEADGLLA
jgi:tetratricopeptide (TPR) repeat protein